jgi:L-serine/L-threonine ammonia-lyase
MHAPLHIRTPLILSDPLSRVLGAEVWLKLECLQPSGSFKIRGIGYLAQQLVARDVTHLVCSSGGNAGIAAALAARRLGITATIIVPRTTSARMRARIEAEGATVRVHGAAWDEADAEARRVAAEPGNAYLPPFDHELIWRGHATMIDEIAAEHPAAFGAVVCSVGGGGLLCGVLEGMHRAGWATTPMLAVETEGAASFDAAVRAGKLVTLERITSIATTLGAKTVCAEALRWASRHEIRRQLVTDDEALEACRRFADDHRLLVEPSCGAALAAVYGQAPALNGASSLLVVVCGGAAVSLSDPAESLSR